MTFNPDPKPTRNVKSRTQINATARKEIARISQKYQFNICFANLIPCVRDAHAPAHRHKRDWYKGQPDELLSDIHQWIPCCIPCHNLMEFDKELTAKIFEQWDRFLASVNIEENPLLTNG